MLTITNQQRIGIRFWDLTMRDLRRSYWEDNSSHMTKKYMIGNRPTFPPGKPNSSRACITIFSVLPDANVLVMLRTGILPLEFTIRQTFSQLKISSSINSGKIRLSNHHTQTEPYIDKLYLLRTFFTCNNDVIISEKGR